MSAPLTLTLLDRPAQRLDLSSLQPEKLATLAASELAAMPLWLGRRRHRLDALFSVEGEDATDLVLNNACNRLDGIGTALRAGRITVNGDAGHYLGRSMSGGEIRVTGLCADYPGSRMSGGYIEVHGNAGTFMGAPCSGERIGMSGGTIVVRGSAGDRAGDRMRRGTIVIRGDAGDYAASRMIAGTMAIGGYAGKGIGTAMRRGTLFLATPPASIPATFNASFNAHSVFLPLMLTELERIDARFGDLLTLSPDRLVGDRACGGAGEILIF